MCFIYHHLDKIVNLSIQYTYTRWIEQLLSFVWYLNKHLKYKFVHWFGWCWIWAAILSYQTVIAPHQTQKVVHMTLHFIALILGIVGICAVFKFHDMVNLEDVYTLHSWIGLGTFCLFGLQVKIYPNNMPMILKISIEISMS